MQICMADGTSCNRLGTLQLQSPTISTVLMVIPQATIDPMKYEELNNEVSTARSFGCASSPIRQDPLMMANRMPAPSSIRAIMYMATDVCQYYQNKSSTLLDFFTMLRKSLDDSAYAHDDAAGED